MSNVFSIMLVGVGGQGTLLASRILGDVLLSQGYDVKVSEVHGMSQRGGSVVTYVKYSNTQVYSPVVTEGEADIIIAFEQLEAARSLPMLKKGGKLITNTQKISPMPVITGAMDYPDDLIGKIKELDVDIVAIDALKLAIEAGSSKAVNVVLMGILSKIMPFDEKIWHDALLENVPKKAISINEKAFAIGREQYTN